MRRLLAMPEERQDEMILAAETIPPTDDTPGRTEGDSDVGSTTATTSKTTHGRGSTSTPSSHMGGTASTGIDSVPTPPPIPIASPFLEGTIKYLAHKLAVVAPTELKPFKAFHSSGFTKDRITEKIHNLAA